MTGGKHATFGRTVQVGDTWIVEAVRFQRGYLPVERYCAHCGGRTLVPAAHFDSCRAITVERMRLLAKLRAQANPVTQRVASTLTRALAGTGAR